VSAIKTALTALTLIIVPGLIGAVIAEMTAQFLPTGHTAQGLILALRFSPIWMAFLWKFSPADVGLLSFQAE